MVGVAQLVEHLVVVQDAAGSSPVTHPRISRDRECAFGVRRADPNIQGFTFEATIVHQAGYCLLCQPEMPPVRSSALGGP